MKRRICCAALFATLFTASTAFVIFAGHAPQRRGQRRSQRPARICFDPTIGCRTSFDFEPHQLRFELPPHAVIYETQEFYAVILKSVPSGGDEDCETFVAEADRLAAQKLFPRRKVFSSRCSEPVSVYYTNAAPKQRFMAVYAGATRAEAGRTLAAVRATGKFPGANLRRMRAGFNGT